MLGYLQLQFLLTKHTKLNAKIMYFRQDTAQSPILNAFKLEISWDIKTEETRMTFDFKSSVLHTAI